MSLKKPETMEDLVYFTRRTIENGKLTAWVHRQSCKKCGKGIMGKPVDGKGKVKMRAKEYICPECGHVVEKKEHEESLTVEIEYTCPYCQHNGETTTPFKRRSFQGTQALVFKCGKCNKDIPITKKMKDF